MNTPEENGNGLSNCEEDQFHSYLIENKIYPTIIYLPIDIIRYVYSFLGAKTLDEYIYSIITRALMRSSIFVCSSFIKLNNMFK